MNELLDRLAERGYQARIMSIQHLSELQKEIERHYRQGQFDEEFYRDRLSWFNFQIPDDLPKAKSLIIVAVPRPQSQAIFKWKDELRALIIPPTYVAYEETRKNVEDLLSRILKTEGYHVARTRLPLKLMAVRSGLAMYGRNNICYVPKIGSFLQLVGVYSDMPCHKDEWQGVQMMERCKDCNACRLKCPTGAISSDRFLLHAERCIVFHNEKKGHIPFPDWMEPSWHNCVVGCMHCQTVCPENKNLLKLVEETEKFSEEETALLLKGASIDQLTAILAAKLRNLDLIEYLDSLPRNLGIFFT